MEERELSVRQDPRSTTEQVGKGEIKSGFCNNPDLFAEGYALSSYGGTLPLPLATRSQSSLYHIVSG